MRRMETTTPHPDTVTFKRTHFYAVLVVLAFLIGILVGYMAWGNGKQTAAAPVAAEPTEQPFRRYDIPTDGFPGTGPANAPIVIVEFSDYQCPYCKRWHDQVYKPLMAAYPGKIRFVYRNLPLTQLHPQALPAAEAALCAGEQDAYWEYHEKIFENYELLSDELYSSLAADLGLDVDAFEICMTEHRYQENIQADMQFSSRIGIQSTPTFFINGIPIVGAQPLSAFQQVIDNELAGNYPK